MTDLGSVWTGKGSEVSDLFDTFPEGTGDRDTLESSRPFVRGEVSHQLPSLVSSRTFTVMLLDRFRDTASS